MDPVEQLAEFADVQALPQSDGSLMLLLGGQTALVVGEKFYPIQADLASAQAATLRGDIKTARELAARAKTRFPVGSPGWVKADDLATYKPQRKTLGN